MGRSVLLVEEFSQLQAKMSVYMTKLLHMIKRICANIYVLKLQTFPLLQC